MAKPVLIYDGDCAFCRRAIAWYRAHDLGQRLEYLPRQSPERVARFPELDQPQFQGTIQLMLPDGRRCAGAEATAMALTHLQGAQWRALGHALQWPGMRPMAQLAYRLIAKYRNRFACTGDVCRR